MITYIKWSEYGKHMVYGWDVYHITPSSKGGQRRPKNASPLRCHVPRGAGQLRNRVEYKF